MPTVFGGGGGPRWVRQPTGGELNKALGRGRKRRAARQGDKYQKPAGFVGPPEEFPLDTSEDVFPLDTSELEDVYELDTSEPPGLPTPRLGGPPTSESPLPPSIHLHRAWEPKGGRYQGGGSAPAGYEELFIDKGVRVTLDSGWLLAARYHKQLQHLSVWFLDGYAVTVLEVDEGLARSFFNAPSFGGWYHDNVLDASFPVGNPRRRRKNWIVGAI